MTLFLREYGEENRLSGPSILLLHGLFGSSANWGQVARKLAEGHHLLVPDLVNHGRSPHRTAISYPDMAADVVYLLDQFGIKQVDLVGHSMGGKVAMELALASPERVNRLVVVDIAPVHYGHDFSDVFAGFAAVDLLSLSSRKEADQRMAGYVADPQVRAYLLQNLQKEAGNWVWRLNLQALCENIDRITGFPHWDRAFEGKVLFLYGGLSDYVNAENQGEIRRLFPQAIIQSVPGAGHWVYAEQPVKFTQQLKEFLSSSD